MHKNPIHAGLGWDERFTSEKHLYTTLPNFHFEKSIKSKTPGKILIPGDGEGRNGVYAASIGWDVTTFDYSIVAVNHALDLAKEKGVKIDARHASITDISFPTETFDLIAMIFLHLDQEIRLQHFPQLVNSLKPGGLMYVFGFNKRQITLTSGGPKDVDMLFSSQEMISDFNMLKVLQNEEFKGVLDEGPKHQGLAELIEFIGQKI